MQGPDLAELVGAQPHAWNEEDEHTSNFTQLFLSISRRAPSSFVFGSLAGKAPRPQDFACHCAHKESEVSFSIDKHID